MNDKGDLPLTVYLLSHVNNGSYLLPCRPHAHSTLMRLTTDYFLYKGSCYSKGWQNVK